MALTFEQRFSKHVFDGETIEVNGSFVNPSSWPALYYADLIAFIRGTHRNYWYNGGSGTDIHASPYNGTSVIEFGVGYGGFMAALMADVPCKTIGYTYIGVDAFDASKCDSVSFNHTMAQICDPGSPSSQFAQLQSKVQSLADSFVTDGVTPTARARLVVEDTASASLPATLRNVALPLTRRVRAFPLVFVDGGHSYSQVINDLINATRIVFESDVTCGTIVLDDYFSADYPGVRTAIDDWLTTPSLYSSYTSDAAFSATSLQVLECASGHKLVYVFLLWA
jgi:hypothetical protein